MMTDLSRMGEAYHLLPESVKTCIGLIGLTKSVRLIHAWGGTTFPVGKNKRKGGQIRFAALAEVVGVEAAEILTRHYSGEVIAIPRCWRACWPCATRRCVPSLTTSRQPRPRSMRSARWPGAMR